MIAAFRSLRRDGFYTTISIAGLAAGAACCLLIAVFVRHELSFDRHYSRADRIVRISRDFRPTNARPEIRLAAMPAAAGPLLALDFPQIETTARIAVCSGASGGALVSSSNATFQESGLAAADNELFRIFDFDWLHGDPATALAEPYSVVLTESAARKYFGRADVLGSPLVLDGDKAVAVTGVIEDLPDNTHLRFTMLVSMLYMAATYGEPFVRQWDLNCFHTYALLRDGAAIADVQRGAGQFVERHLGEGASRFTSFTALPVTDVHLSSNREGEMSTPGSNAAVLAFGAVATFVLALACINFVNLATARSARRAKEVGVRKVAGSNRVKLICRFLAESMVVAAVSVVAATAAAKLLSAPFASFVQKDLRLDYGDPVTLTWIGALTVLVGVAAGSYPALYLSAFNPSRVLRGDLTRGETAATLRKALVVLQFTISISLIIATIVVLQQTRYAQNIELGYEKNRIVVLRGSPTGGLGPQWETLKRELLAHPEVTGVTASSLLPGTTNNNSVPVAVAGAAADPQSMALMIVDFGFFETYGVDVVSGRTFSEDFTADRLAPAATGQRAAASLVLSALAARRLGLGAEEALGKSLDAFGVSGTIVGVVEDVRYESVRNAIKPVVYVVAPQPLPGQPAILREASIRVTGRDLGGTLAHIEAKWQELVPEQPLARRFLAQDFDELYRDEQRQARMLLYCSLLAIFIACLGMLGLASFATQQRRKEIGIRKVMGGSVWDIAWLFTAEFAKLVLLASVIAWPIAYALLQRWLEGFAYRVELTPVVFVAGGLAGLLVAVLTVGLTAALAGTARPVHSLRYE